MQSSNKLFEDFARLAGGALSAAAAVREEMAALARQQLDRLLAEMQLVTREEFDAVRDMAARAREEQERLELRVAALEEAHGQAGGAVRSAAPRKPRRRPAAGPGNTAG